MRAGQDPPAYTTGFLSFCAPQICGAPEVVPSPEGSGLRGCPRCGEPINWVERRVVGDRVYYYAAHVSGSGRKGRRVRKCYLGPQTYTYVERLNVISLKGLLNEERYLEYIVFAALRYLGLESSDPSEALAEASDFDVEELEEGERLRRLVKAESLQKTLKELELVVNEYIKRLSIKS